MGKFFRFTATGFCVGEFAGAPGTYGTIVAVVLYLLFSSLPPLSYALFAITFVFLSIWIVRGALPHFETDDPSEIVIDEIAGFFVAMIALPFSWLYIGMAFILFRFYDIVKPPPIRTIDRKLKGPLGIVLDDVLAGVFTAITIWLIRIIFGV